MLPGIQKTSADVKVDDVILKSPPESYELDLLPTNVLQKLLECLFPLDYRDHRQIEKRIR